MYRGRAFAALVTLAACVSPPLRAQDSIVAFRATWGSGPNDVWVVGTGNGALHWDGRVWGHVLFGPGEPSGLQGLWGSGPRDIFAVGTAGVILHWDGRVWHRMASGTERDLVGVAGRSPTEVYAVAQSEEEMEPPLLLRYDGRSWKSTPLPIPFRASGIAIAGGEVLVAGRVFFDPTPSQRRVAGVLARYAGDRFVLSGYDGRQITDSLIGNGAWRSVSAGGSALLLFGDQNLTAGLDNPTAFAAASGGALTRLPPVPGMAVDLAFVPGDGVPVVVSSAGFARYAAGRWAPAAMTTQPPDFPNPFRGFSGGPAAAWGASSRDFWIFLADAMVVRVVGDRVSIELALDCQRPDSFANPDIATYCRRLR
jgi:hypothetical protein